MADLYAIDRRMRAMDRASVEAARKAPPCPCCGHRLAPDYSHRATWLTDREAERAELIASILARG